MSAATASTAAAGQSRQYPADINRLLREAAANEIAAGRHEDRYEQQMKAAGANVYAAFVIALRTAPEYQGRKLDDKACERIYLSTNQRLWWDKYLASVKVENRKADREWAKRLIQWHLDPAAAQARRAQHVISVVASRKRLAKERAATARGAMLTPKRAENVVRLDAHAKRITEASQAAALAGRELPDLETAAAVSVSVNDLLGEVARIQSAVRKVAGSVRDKALEVLRVTAREIEELT